MPRKRKERIWRIETPRLTREEEQARSEIAFAAIRKLYAESLPLWTVCPRGFCRRHQTCGGEAHACVKRAWPLLPEAVQLAAYDLVQVGGPRRVPPASPKEYRLRHYPPTNFVL